MYKMGESWEQLVNIGKENGLNRNYVEMFFFNAFSSTSKDIFSTKWFRLSMLEDDAAILNVILHFPPFYQSIRSNEIINLLDRSVALALPKVVQTLLDFEPVKNSVTPEQLGVMLMTTCARYSVVSRHQESPADTIERTKMVIASLLKTERIPNHYSGTSLGTICMGAAMNQSNQDDLDVIDLLLEEPILVQYIGMALVQTVKSSICESYGVPVVQKLLNTKRVLKPHLECGIEAAKERDMKVITTLLSS